MEKKIVLSTLRLIKNSNIFNYIPKSNFTNNHSIICMITLEYNRMKNILENDPYNKLFLDGFNIKDTFLYKDILKNEKILSWLILINLHMIYGVTINFQEQKKIYNKYIHG